MRYERPPKATESDVQAEFYRRCRNAGLEIHLEYRVSGCRFDAVIVRGDHIVAIIECKPRVERRQKQAIIREESQRTRYGSFGVPVIWVRGLEDVEAGYAEVRRIIAVRSGGGWKRREGQSDVVHVAGL